MSDYKRFVIDETVYETFLFPEFEPPRPADGGESRRIHAAIRGVIEWIQVERGQSVKRGERLLVLEGMRTRSEILSPRDGIARALAVARGQKVARDETLLELD